MIECLLVDGGLHEEDRALSPGSRANAAFSQGCLLHPFIHHRNSNVTGKKENPAEAEGSARTDAVATGRVKGPQVSEERG
jgi:hypothetical protein